MKLGTWGTSLYANDPASDIRGEYVDKLRRGKTNAEATQELINSNQEIMGDVEEEPLFWFALADTQWNYGRLLPEVNEKALLFLSQDQELQRWTESGEKQLNAWKDTLDKLKGKLLTPPPPEKKVSAYRLYQCKWQFGDVFAYQMNGAYSKEINVSGQYIIFRKISEDVWWPGHVVPAVHVYQWIGSDIPSLDEIRSMDLLPQGFLPIAYNNNPNREKEYVIKLLSTSEKVIPKDNLTFLGNMQGDDLIPYRGPDYWTGYPYIVWSKFEKKILDQYYAWNPKP
jgi:hypothetical protein